MIKLHKLLGKKIFIIASAIIIFVGGLSWILYTDKPNENMEVVSTTSRAYTYKNLEQIDKDAQLVMRGRVVGAGLVKEIKDPSVNMPTAENPILLYTDHDVLVKKVWKGNKELVGKKIIVRQTGGTKGNTIAKTEEKQLRDGEEVVLFLELSRLREQLPEKDGWTILGIDAGHATVERDQVQFDLVDPFAQEFIGKSSENIEQALEIFYKKQ